MNEKSSYLKDNVHLAGFMRGMTYKFFNIALLLGIRPYLNCMDMSPRCSIWRNMIRAGEVHCQDTCTESMNRPINHATDLDCAQAR